VSIGELVGGCVDGEIVDAFAIATSAPPQPMQCKAPATNIGVLGLDQQGDLSTSPSQELGVDQSHGTSADDADLRAGTQGFGSLVEIFF